MLNQKTNQKTNQNFYQMKNQMLNRMKKTVVMFSCIFLFATASSFAQGIFQLPNNGFETWYRETSNAGSIVPDGFHSFYSASGSVASIGAGKRCDSSRDVRNGATGVFSLKLYSSTVLTIRANGNVTTGRINAGSTTASNASNYNYTDAPNYSQKITGTPDSLRFWVKYLPGRNQTPNITDKGRIRVFIHGTGEGRDAANFPSGKVEEDYYYGKAMKEFYKEDGGWHQYTVPFVYDGRNTQKDTDSMYYVLVSMTTNATPGGGANNADEAWFDDVEFIYSTWLTDLRINDTTIAGFEKGFLNYAGPTLVGLPPYAFPYQPNQITYTTESNEVVSVVVSNVNGIGGDADGGYTSILITGEDSVTTKEYKIHYYSNRSADNTIAALGYTMHIDSAAIAVPGFVSSTLNYNITLTDPEEVRIPIIREEDVILSDSTATIERITQPSGVNSIGSIMVRAEDFSTKVYTLTFAKTVSTNSSLADLTIGGANINFARFNPINIAGDTLVLDTLITSCVTSMPAVAAVTASPWATRIITSATMSNRTATVVVISESDDTTVYQVNFILSNNNASLTGYRVGSTNRNVFDDTTFVDDYSTSFTTAPTLSVQSSQQVCGASSIVVSSPIVPYPDTNYITVTAQDGITTQTYQSVLRNTNCYLTTGNNNSVRYTYNGQAFTNINISSGNNNNNNPVTVSRISLPAGPNVPPVVEVFGLVAANFAPPAVQIVQPATRNDTAVITLTANDGITQKIYKIPFAATLSTDATLSDIKCNDSSIVGFSPNITHYTIMLPPSATQVPTVVATPTFQWLPLQNIVVVPAADLLDTTKIIVTAENGTTIRTYYIDFDVEPIDNAYLRDLRYDNITIAGFRPTTLTYVVDIPYSTQTPPVVSATPMAANSNVFYSQPTLSSYQGKVLVYSENMAGMKIYTVNFNKVKSTDSTLSDIRVNGISLQNFNPQVFSYNVNLPYTDLNAPIVAATPNYLYAQVNITQIDTVTGTVTINVTAEDSAYACVYTIGFTRELSPVTTIDSIEYQYNSQTYKYAVSANSGTQLNIMLPAETEGVPTISGIILSDNRSTVQLTQQPVAINTVTSEGIVTVTAEDLTVEVYNISFERILSNSVLVTNILYGGIPVPNFNPATTSYAVLLPFSASQAPAVSVELDWKYTDTNFSQTINSNGGRATINVISENRQNNISYMVTFQRQGSVRLINLFYNLGGGAPVAVSASFDPATLRYTVNLPIATTDIPVLTYVAEDGRALISQNALSTPEGTIKLTVITANGIPDTLTYEVTFTVIRSTEALLSDLQVDGITIDNFNPNQTNYSIEYEYATTTLPLITATATQPDARIKIESITGYPQTAVITVYAGDTTILRTYHIAFSLEAGNNNYLSNILIDGVSLPNFKKNVFSYEVKLPYGTLTMPVVTATVEDHRAEATITQASQPHNTAIIEVMALNKEYAEYRVGFVVAKNDNAHASKIFIDGVELIGFDPNNREYTYELSANYTGMPFVTVVLEDPDATCKIESSTSVFGRIVVTVTAADGQTQFVYRINFTKHVSIVSYDNQTEIQVYPNPTNNQLRIINYELQNRTIEIYDVVGRKIVNGQLSIDNSIDVSFLESGMYYLKIDTKLVRFVKN